MARILVVEDDGALRYDMSQRVTEWGHVVRVASNGRQGFEAIEEWQPDMVLSDINMPDKTGFDLMRHVKAQGAEFADMAFLFISSRSTQKMIVEGFEIGADDYLTKPVDYNLLKAKLDAHLRKRSALLTKRENDHVTASLRNGTAFAATFAIGALLLGISAFMIVYWFKSILGINIFADVHLSDFF